MNQSSTTAQSQEAKWPGLDTSRLPRHLAIIMDGNGRWAEMQGLSRIRGHAEGAESVRVIVTACLEIGIPALTIYTFSTENWGRPETEVRALMELFLRYLRSETKKMIKNGIRLTTIGQTERLPQRVQKAFKRAQEATAHNKKMILNLALSYGSRNEIVEVASELARRCLAGLLDPDEIDEELFSSLLQTAGLPQLDLIIRTSGEYRLSNFLLWQAAYAEIIVVPTMWPDFKEEALINTLIEYQNRQRRFGLTSEQVEATSEK
jgi:undecaprenyl diphosphate synthase